MCTDRDQPLQQATTRLCVSLLASSTAANVWFSADPALAAGATRSYTTSAVNPVMSIRVLRAAFPLGEAQQDVLRGLGGLPSEPRNGTTTATATSSTTNPGIIAGIVVGCLALLGLIAVGVYLCVRHRKEGKQEEEEHLKRKLEATEASTEMGLMGRRDKSKEKHAVEFQELPAPVARPPHGRFTEMSADTGVAELPTEYHTTNMAQAI